MAGGGGALVAGWVKTAGVVGAGAVMAVVAVDAAGRSSSDSNKKPDVVVVEGASASRGTGPDTTPSTESLGEPVPPPGTSSTSTAPTTTPTTTTPSSTTSAALTTTAPPTTLPVPAPTTLPLPPPLPPTTVRTISPTTRPPPPPPTTTVRPPPSTGASCHPSYTPCVPVASDVDCGGGSGNGPAYVWTKVKVIGPDVYGLDADNDGWGCDSLG